MRKSITSAMMSFVLFTTAACANQPVTEPVPPPPVVAATNCQQYYVLEYDYWHRPYYVLTTSCNKPVVPGVVPDPVPYAVGGAILGLGLGAIIFDRHHYRPYRHHR